MPRSPLSYPVAIITREPSGEIAKSETSLVTVGNNASLWVWADLYERDLAQVAAAQAKAPLAAQISVKAFIDQEFPGTVNFISPAMDESSRTVKLRIEELHTLLDEPLPSAD